MNILSINTSSNEEVSIVLEYDGKTEARSARVGREKAQEVLPMLESLLQDLHLRLSDINAIRVVTGPGSFTGIRVGVSIANALGILLRIPINSMPVGKLAEPVYS
jgi:tRNA threonylcarbamoyladenosine biosynthesis protein TsaB